MRGIFAPVASLYAVPGTSYSLPVGFNYTSAKALGGDEFHAEPVGYEVPQDKVTMIKVDIKNEGIIITDNITSVIVGEKISLEGLVQPSGLAISSVQWTIQNANEVIKDWEITLSPSHLGYQAHIVPLTTMNQPVVEFYWINGSFDGRLREVKYKVTLNGTDYEGKTIFKVHRPTIQISVANNQVYLNDPSYTRPGKWVNYGLGNFGGPPHGVEARVAIQVPTGFSPQPDGVWYEKDVVNGVLWVQLGNFNRSLKKESDGKCYEFKSGDYFLDEYLPYIGGNYFNDSPAELLDGNAWLEISNEEYKTWLMWLPSGDDSIPIPMEIIVWSWSASTMKDASGTWMLNSSAYPAPSYVDTTVFPEWIWSKQDVQESVVPCP